jgi:outer membrane usher protein
VGDTISDPGTWGNAVRYAGLQLSSSQTQRADLISGNSLALSGLAILPTTADALLAMDPASQSRLAQRGLSLAKAPTVVASGVSLAAHDAAGRTTAITQALLPKQSSAQVGCKSYSVGVGRARRDYALASNNYGPLFANTNVLCGTDSGLAVEVHGEFLQGEAGIAGLNVSQKIGSGSAASVGFATSDNETGNGWALRMGLQHSDDRFDMSLRGRVQSIDYRELGMLSSDEPIAQRWLASVGAKLTDKSRLALAFTNQTTYSLHRTDILAMTQTFELGRRGTFSIAANRVFNDEDIGSINFSYVRPLRAN